MYCEQCKLTKQTNIWATGTNNFRRDLVVSHSKPGENRKSLHQQAEELCSTRKVSASEAKTDMFETYLKVDDSDLMVSLKTMYHVIHDDNAAFTKYESQLDFLADFNVTLTKANKPGNANLRSQRLKDEIIDVLGNTVFESIKQEIEDSPYISVLINETQDITTIEQLIIYIKYLRLPESDSRSDPEIKTTFAGIVPVNICHCPFGRKLFGYPDIVYCLNVGLS